MIDLEYATDPVFVEKEKLFESVVRQRYQIDYSSLSPESTGDEKKNGPTSIDFGLNTSGQTQVCSRKKKPNTSELFAKSLKFFSFVFVVGLILSMLCEFVIGFNRIYVYFLIGLAVSVQATYYKYRVWMDPSYKPDCDCAQPEPEQFIPSTQDMMNGVFTVLGHKKSAILFNIPNTVFGVLFYTFMILINYTHFYMYGPMTLLATLTSCVGSVYLWYTMIVEVKSVCVICSTIHAVNFLTLVALMFGK